MRKLWIARRRFGNIRNIFMIWKVLMRTEIIKRGCLAFVLITLMVAFCSASAEESFAVGETVSRIEYVGNRRTTDKTMDRLTGVKVGMLVSEIDGESIRQRLLRSNLFSKESITVDRGESGAVVTVTVEEKITMFPLPYGTASGGGWTVGLGLIDTNFLGEQKNVVVMGSLSDNGWSAFGMYMDPAFLGSLNGLSATLSASDGTKKMSWMDGDSFAEYSAKALSAGASLSVPLVGALRLSFGGSGSYTEISASDAASFGMNAKSTYAIARTGLLFDSRRSDGHFMSGLSATADYRYALSAGEASDYRSIEGRVVCSGIGPMGIYEEIGGSAKYGTQKMDNLNPLMGKGFRTLPQQTSFSAKAIASYAELNLPVCRNRFGILTVNGCYEAGTYQTGPDNDRQWDRFAGPGLGLSVFLDKIALPALGINAAYNLETATPVISATFGLALN